MSNHQNFTWSNASKKNQVLQYQDPLLLPEKSNIYSTAEANRPARVLQLSQLHSFKFQETQLKGLQLSHRISYKKNT